MGAALYHVTERARLKALEDYGLDNDVMQAELEPLNRLATALFGVPTSMVSVVTQARTLFASRIGISVCEVERDISFCTHTLDRHEPLIILDASLDPRFSSNPLVSGSAHVRFYAGAPLIGPGGHVIGSFCLLDTRPRNAFTAADAVNLKLLASLALDKMELRRLARAQETSENRFRQIAATSPAGIVCTDSAGRIQFWNRGAEIMFGYSAAEAEGRTIDLIVPEGMRGHHTQGMERLAAGGKPTLIGKSVELLACCKDGRELPIELALSMWQEHGQISFGAIIRDLSTRRANEERLYHLAHFDQLTGLPNRLVLRHRLEEIASGEAPAALLTIDLDGFKQVNDMLGHSAGDRLLKVVAARLLAAIGPTDTAARIGGDEFAVILPATGADRDAGITADRIISALSQPILIDEVAFNISASVGIALYPLHGNSVEELMTGADLALYDAKAEGRHCRRYYTPSLLQAAHQQHALEAELRQAFERDQFELFYQPQVDRDGMVIGAEALIRWRHPERGLQSPAAFIAHLERSPLAVKVGHWVLQTACAQAVLWQRQQPAFRMGVNLFGTQLHTGNLIADVGAILTETGLPPEALELEVTENIILGHKDAMVTLLKALRDQGIGLAFDDFGTGYASLSLLKRYPISRLKIDQSFVRNLSHSPQDAAIVRAIVHMGKAFNLNIIAEGVEDEEQRARLLHKGCDALQGYLFGRPMPADDFTSTFGFYACREQGLAA